MTKYITHTKSYLVLIISMNITDSQYHEVYIWMSIGAKQFGHSSLLLCNGIYISWWPKGKKMKCGPLSKVGDCSSCLAEDVEKETFEPDYTFRISNEVANVDLMTRYWKSWLTRGHYALLNRNCCSMVYRVLLKGGARRSATFLWRPETLRRYIVILNGGGTRSQLFWNWPTYDREYKGLILHISMLQMFIKSCMVTVPNQKLGAY